MLSAGRSGRFHGALPGRSVILAMAVANGIRAAQAAKDGVGGDPALLDGPWLKDAQGIDAKVEALTAGLGSGSIYPQMTIKPFCSAKQAIAAIEAFTTIIDDGVAPDTISKVVVRVPPPYARMVAMKPEAGARASTIVSAAFQIGLAAYHRERLYDIERADAMDGERGARPRRQGRDRRRRIACSNSSRRHFPAEVEVTAGGKTLRKRVTAADGDPGRAARRRRARRQGEAHSRRGIGGDRSQVGLDGFKNEDSCKRLADALVASCTDGLNERREEAWRRRSKSKSKSAPKKSQARPTPRSRR